MRHSKPQSASRLNLALAAIGLASSLLPAGAVAQTQPTTPPAPPAPKVEKIQVTGTNIKRVDAETASPITVITSEDIRNSGATTIQELLNNLPMSSGSALTDIAPGNGFSPGAATVALRGLGSSATLTLINGRRISPAAFNDPNVGNTVITNLNAIPAAAIERIEVLRDGASAVYGSDAIAGVVNVILKKDFQGLVATATANQNLDNEFRTTNFSVAGGFGDLAKSGYNVFGSYERFERDSVLISKEDNVSDLWRNPTFIQRQSVLSSLSYPGNYYREAVRGSNIFGTFAGVVPGCPANLVIGSLCRYDQWADLEQSGKSERNTAFVRGTLDINETLSAFAEASFSRTVNTFTGAPPASNPQTPTVWRDPAGQLLSFQLVLPVGHRENPFAFPIGLRYRWVDLGRSVTEATTEDSRFLAGLKGVYRNWDWEAAYLYNKSSAETLAGRRFLFPGIRDAITDGSYNFSGPNNQAVIDRISTNTVGAGDAVAKLFDFKATGEVGKLSGVPIGVAVGAEFRKDTISIRPDAQIAAGNIVGLGASFGSGERDVRSAYAEAVLPFTRDLEATLALRHDSYSDFGNSTNPKIGLKWRPLKNVMLRSSYTTGFRAPTLSQTSRSAIRSFQSVNDPIRCPVTATNEDCGRSPSVSSQIVFNPSLDAETSSTRALGLVWDIGPNSSFAIDYFDIRRENEIDRFSSNFQVNALFNGDTRFAPFVFRDPNPLTWIPGVPNSGPIQGVDRAWLNLGASQVTGIDIDASHRHSLGANGRLTGTLSATYNISAKNAREKGEPLIDYVGGVNTVTTGNGLPRFRGNLGLTWDKAPWSIGARLNYISSWNNFSSQFNCAAWNGAAVSAAIPEVCKVKGWRTIDVNATYTGIKNLTLRLVVRNITNEKPPFDFSGGDLTLGFNPSFHNAFGIYPSFSGTYTFK